MRIVWSFSMTSCLTLEESFLFSWDSSKHCSSRSPRASCSDSALVTARSSCAARVSLQKQEQCLLIVQRLLLSNTRHQILGILDYKTQKGKWKCRCKSQDNLLKNKSPPREIKVNSRSFNSLARIECQNKKQTSHGKKDVIIIKGAIMCQNVHCSDKPKTNV